jgi:hypothetical protein
MAGIHCWDEQDTLKTFSFDEGYLEMLKFFVTATMGLALGTNAIASGNNPDDFERGFLAGKKTCEHLRALWTCAATCTYLPSGVVSQFNAEGATRAEVLSFIMRFGDCAEQVRAGKYSCREL